MQPKILTRPDGTHVATINVGPNRYRAESNDLETAKRECLRACHRAGVDPATVKDDDNDQAKAQRSSTTKRTVAADRDKAD